MASKLKFTLIFALIFSLLMPAMPSTTLASTAPPIKVEIDGDVIQFDQGALLINNRTMVPMRKIFEELDSNVHWNQTTRTITATRGTKKVVLTVGSTTATVNDKRVTLDAPPQVINGRTLVPIRFISESLGAKVHWDGAKRIVKITTVEFLERYYFVSSNYWGNHDIQKTLTQRQYDYEYNFHQRVEELVYDEVIHFLLDDVRLFYSEHTNIVYIDNKAYDAIMYVNGIAQDGKALGEYIIYIFELDNYEEEVFTFEGEFTDIPYNRNLRTAIRKLIHQNHMKIFNE